MRCPICKEPIQSWKLMCKRHWALVPAELQDKILASYKRHRGRGAGRETHMKLCLEAVQAVRSRQAPTISMPYRDD